MFGIFQKIVFFAFLRSLLFASAMKAFIRHYC